MPKALVLAIAARLKAITDHEPLLSETPDGIRVVVRLPDPLTDRGRVSLLLTLAEADRFGHDLTTEGGSVWAEVRVNESRMGRSG